MRRKAIAIISALTLTVMVVLAVAMGTRDQAQAQAATPDDISLCIPPVICTTVSVTIRATVKVPTTIRLPAPPAVTKLITLPPLVRTRIVSQTRTVTVRPPGSTTTVVINREVVHNGTSAPVTREVRVTQSQKVTTGQVTTTRGTIVPKKEVVRIPGRTVTKFQAVGIGLLTLLALMALGLFLLWLGFVLGYRSSDKNNRNFLRALRDSVKKPGKHQ